MALPTQSRVAWPVAHAGAEGPTSTNYRGADRHRSRHPYKSGGGRRTDPLLGSKPRVIIAYDGFSLGQQAPR